jgi:hypothetical protein
MEARAIGCGAVAVYRNDETIARVRVPIVMFAVVGLGVGVLGVVRVVVSDEGGILAPAASLALIVIGGLALFLLRRAAQVSIESSREGITVRNVTSTRRIPWSEVVGFERDERRRGVTQFVVRTTDGSTHPMTACGDAGTRCARILEGLRIELATARETG